VLEHQQAQIVQTKAEEILHTFRRFLLQLGATDTRSRQLAFWLDDTKIKHYEDCAKLLWSRR